MTNATVPALSAETADIATLLGSIIGSITALLHRCDHAFEQIKAVNVFCNPFDDIHMR